MTLSERLHSVLDLQAGEAKPVGIMTAYFMLLILAFLIGRTVRDALFLAKFGMNYLPYMYILTAVVVSITSQVYTRLAPKVNPRWLGYISIVGFALCFALFRMVAANNGGLVALSALYLWVEIFGGLALLEFWNLAGEVFAPRQAKRLYGLVSAGQVVSNILCGALSSALSHVWGAENLLWLSSASLLCVLPLLVVIGNFRSGKRTAKKAPPKLDPKDPTYRQHMGYLRAVAAVVALTFLSTSIIDFQFKLAAKDAYPNKDELARYFGVFYASVGTFGFFLQTFFTGRITKALGVLETLMMMPGFFIAGSIFQVFMPGLAAATGTKFSENTLRYSINDPVTQLLYLPLPSNLRLRALALASGTIKPWAVGAAGLVMLAVGSYGKAWPAAFSIVVIFFCVVWIALLTRLKRGYLGAVASGAEESRRLVWERPRLDPKDPLVRETLLRTLRDAVPEKTDYALSLAEKVDIEGLDECLRICLQKSGTGRARVLRTIEVRRDVSFISEVRACIDPSEIPATQAAALRALAALEGERAMPLLRRGVGSHSPVIRAAALEGLISYCGEKGLSIAMADLDKMLAASDSAVRVLAVRIIAHTRAPHPFQMLESMLADSEPEVLREVIRTLGIRCDEEALESLLGALSNPAASNVAADAVAKFGKKVVEPLVELLIDNGNPPHIREAALRGLAANSSAAAADAMATHLQSLPVNMRILAAIALQRRARMGEWAPADAVRTSIEKACLEEVREAAWFSTVADSVANLPAVVAGAVKERAMASELQSLRLCTLLWPNEQLLALCRPAVLLDPYKRQLLLEICDNILGGSVKDIIFTLLESHAGAKRRSMAEKFRPFPANALHTFVALDSVGGSWLRACAVWGARSQGNEELFASKPGAQAMMDLVEKVLLLKSATLFQHLTGEDIEKIANIAQECEFTTRQAIFEQGDPGDALYIVTDGQVRIHIGEKQIALLTSRDCFGEMAILDDQPRSASVTAVTNVKCLLLRRDDFFFLLEDHFEIVKSIIRVLTERLRNNLAQAAPPPPPKPQGAEPAAS